MQIQDLIKAIELNFQEIKPGTITPEMKMNELVFWNSFNILLLLTVVKEEFGVVILWKDLRAMSTVSELYQAIIEAKNES